MEGGRPEALRAASGLPRTSRTSSIVPSRCIVSVTENTKGGGGGKMYNMERLKGGRDGRWTP